MATRKSNETRFLAWEELPEGGRRYWREVPGKRGRRLRYVKVVDGSEKTISFTQEIYDLAGTLIEIHEKFPVDKGHQRR